MCEYNCYIGQIYFSTTTAIPHKELLNKVLYMLTSTDFYFIAKGQRSNGFICDLYTDMWSAFNFCFVLLQTMAQCNITKIFGL